MRPLVKVTMTFELEGDRQDAMHLATILTQEFQHLRQTPGISSAEINTDYLPDEFTYRGFDN